mmetsp:Transcript_7094/g.13929  ORF Transcript_7094/g.13929 Transcript_7094/m.13929 type:complete len:94 (-) Transcript_7094:1736-2017(-)
MVYIGRLTERQAQRKSTENCRRTYRGDRTYGSLLCFRQTPSLPHPALEILSNKDFHPQRSPCFSFLLFKGPQQPPGEKGSERRKEKEVKNKDG